MLHRVVLETQLKALGDEHHSVAEQFLLSLHFLLVLDNALGVAMGIADGETLLLIVKHTGTEGGLDGLHHRRKRLDEFICL